MTDPNQAAGRPAPSGRLTGRRFDAVDDAWRGVLRHLVDFGEAADGTCDRSSVGSHFAGTARPIREDVGAAFSIRSPRRRLVLSRARPLDLGFAIAGTIWTLLGSDAVDEIAAYNPRGRSFSDDGRTLAGALGARVFRSAAGDQFEAAAARLKEDPGTRRAVVAVFGPADAAASSRDCPCLVSLQFLLRSGRLSCVAFMRSQSALMVMPYDLFVLTMLHEAMAVRVGAPLGEYHHACGSLHYYADEQAVVEQVLLEPPAAPGEMPPMPRADAALREALSAAEAAVRRGLARGEPGFRSTSAELPDYWRGLVTAMAAGAAIRAGSRLARGELAQVAQPYRAVLALRQQTRGPASGKCGDSA